MLKLSLSPGEYIQIGDNIQVIYSGGSPQNIHLLVDAPKDINVARSKAMVKRNTLPKGQKAAYKKEQTLSKESQNKIKQIILEEKKKNKEKDL